MGKREVEEIEEVKEVEEKSGQARNRRGLTRCGK
jgi:hypothetical protein